MGDSFASKEEVSTLKASIDRLEKMLEQLLADKNKSTNVEVSSTDGEPPHRSAGSTPYEKGQHNDTAPPTVVHQGVPERAPRFDFPHFSGTEDPLSWLYRCELYFMNQHVPPASRVPTASYYLTGEAQLWYHHLRQDHTDLSWDQFRNFCTHRFGPPGSANLLGDLSNLKQLGRPVEDYITDFQTRLARVPPLRTEYQVALFTAGLDEVLRLAVEYQQPLNLTMAISISRMFARKLQLLSSSPVRENLHPPKAPPGILPANSQVPNPNPIAAPLPPTQPPPSTQPPPPTPAPTSHTTVAPLKRLTRAEAAERRAKGLCYNCDEPYVPGHSCKRLFCLWIEGDEEAGESSNGPTTRTQGWFTNTAHHYPNVT
ncbi:hypothetical protein LINGRAHAP2_LOCUS35196 [Linum grandiflorum]